MNPLDDLADEAAELLDELDDDERQIALRILNRLLPAFFPPITHLDER